MEIKASSSFCRAFDFASGATAERFQNPLWRVTEIFLGHDIHAAIREVKTYGRTIVASAVQRRAVKSRKQGKEDLMRSPHTQAVDGSSGSLIDALLDELEDAETVSDATLNFLSAGKDTIAQALTWTFYLLMRHPRAVTEVRNELRTVLSETGDLQLSFESVQSSILPYTLSVFLESLRLYPPIPFELKQCTSETTLPDGTYLPKDAIVVWCVWAMGRSKHIWGEDSTTFRPERWLLPAKDDKDGPKQTKNFGLISKTPFEYPVFNGGPRACLGKKMAELQAIYVIATLVHEFDFLETTDEGQEPVGELSERISSDSLTLPMKNGLPCRVRKRATA